MFLGCYIGLPIVECGDILRGNRVGGVMSLSTTATTIRHFTSFNYIIIILRHIHTNAAFSFILFILYI